METPALAANLVVSEIQYAPAIPTGAELAVSSDVSDYEWMELMNAGDEVIQLTDVHFETGINFSFTGSAITM